MNKGKQKRNLHPCRKHDKSFIIVGRRLSDRNSSIWVYLFLQKTSTSESTSQNCRCKAQQGFHLTHKTFLFKLPLLKRWCEIFMYLSCHISKGCACIQCTITHKQLHFFVRTFLLWVTSAEVTYHRRNKYLVWTTHGRWFDSHKAENCHSPGEQQGTGHWRSSVNALSGLLGFSFLVPSCGSLKGQIPEAKLFWTEAIWLTLTQLPNRDKMTHPTLFGIWSGREMTSLFCQRPLLFNILQIGRNCI